MAKNLELRANKISPTLPAQFDGLRLQDGRHGLIITAADTFLPDASPCSLPSIAQEEVEAGLAGEIRLSLADSDESLDNIHNLTHLAVSLMDIVAGGHDIDSVLSIALDVYLLRVAAGIIPPAVGIACLGAYGTYGTARSDDAKLFADAAFLTEQWVMAPDHEARNLLNEAMGSIAGLRAGSRVDDVLNTAI